MRVLDLPRCAGYLAWEMSSSTPYLGTARGQVGLTKIALGIECVQKLRIHGVHKNSHELEAEALGLHHGLSVAHQTVRALFLQAQDTAPPDVMART